MTQEHRAGIVGTGSALPPKVLTNAYFEQLVETSDEWIVTRTGIKERRMADEKTATSDLSVEAGRKALEMAGMKPEDLDGIIIATITPDNTLPSTACWVQNVLGAKKAGAFDITAACSGFIYGISCARAFINSGMMRNVLVVGAECLTKITNYKDRGSCILFGDGAGAAVLAPTDGKGEVLYTSLGSDGSGGDLMITHAGGSRLPTSQQTLDLGEHLITLRGREVFKFAVLKMQDLLDEIIEKNSLPDHDVEWVVPHQVNIRILQAAIERHTIPIERVYVNIDRYGNTGAASIPIALDELIRSGKVNPGDHIALVAFGGGLTWGAGLIRW